MKENKRKAGRPTETLKVEGSWKDAVAHALQRGKPPAKPKKSAGKKRP